MHDIDSIKLSFWIKRTRRHTWAARRETFLLSFRIENNFGPCIEFIKNPISASFFRFETEQLVDDYFQNWTKRKYSAKRAIFNLAQTLWFMFLFRGVFSRCAVYVGSARSNKIVDCLALFLQQTKTSLLFERTGF